MRLRIKKNAVLSLLQKPSQNFVLLGSRAPKGGKKKKAELQCFEQGFENSEGVMLFDFSCKPPT